MHLQATLLAAVLAIHGAVGSPINGRSPYVVKETHEPPSTWTKLGRAHGKGTVRLQIGLKQGNVDALLKDLHEVSDPDHPRYGKYLSPEQVNDHVKPADETIELVEEWLRDNGVTTLEHSAAKDWVTIHLPLEMVERLLDTEYHNYQHKDGGVVARTTRWSLPRHLHDHIDTIQPTTSFFRAAAQKQDYVDFVLAPVEVPASYQTPKDSAVANVCNVTSVTPECFATLYKTKGYTPKAAARNSVAFTNYLGEIPIRPDTELFLKKYRPEAVSTAKTFTQNSIQGGPVQDGPLNQTQAAEGISHEANLDIQAIAGISWPIPVDSYSTGGSPPFTPDLSTPTDTNEPYLDWANWMLQPGRKLPHVISTSYGDSEQTVPRSYAERVCLGQFTQLGARGVSLVFSSGDNGVGATDTCVSNDGKNTTKFMPAFPASCPYVTAVGGTMNFEPEQAVYRLSRNGRDFYAGGSGFSNYFPRPLWQNQEVKEYIKKINGSHDGLYNKNGRAYPDISAQSLYFAYFWNGTEGTISGTSASSPLSAGILALVNDALIASGKPVLGYLNPWLYKKGKEGFTDIKLGRSPGCNTDGFPALEGWDPVTGWGTPNFPKLVEAAGCRL